MKYVDQFIFVCITSSEPLTWKQTDKIFGERNGCMAIERRLPYKWPLALDVFKRQYDALVSGHLLAFQADYFEKAAVGQTFEVKLLGKVGYFTTDPKNLEAILLTRFEGKSLTGTLIGNFYRSPNCLCAV
jgi:hypothetical protein